MSKWREVVRRELDRYREETGFDVVERQELLDQCRPVLEEEFPDAATPGQTLSRVLQELRDRDELAFLDHAGTYRILDLDTSAMATRQSGGESPEPTVPTAATRYEARTYETTVRARSMPVAFRNAVLSWYDACCPISGIDHASLLDVAHIRSFSDNPDYRTDPGNVLVLDKTHHEAFDRGHFTVDSDYRIRVAPTFETDSDHLRRTILDRVGDRPSLPADRRPAAEHLRAHNADLEWWDG